MAWFRLCFAEAGASEDFDPARAALATVDETGAPDVRYVLVRAGDDDSFLFYTNYRSPKAQQLASASAAALAFHWSTLDTQVRVRGRVETLASEGSDVYFAGRPRGSQLAAWASRQSRPIVDRQTLEARFEATARRFPEPVEVPRPEFWGGYRLLPVEMEFWRSRESRLHDRWLFTRAADGWERQRLQP